MDLLWFVVALCIMLVGLVGTVIPMLPGLPLILVGIVVYAVATWFEGGVGIGHLIVYLLVGGGTYVVAAFANVFGAKAGGASRAGVVGAVLGLVAGLFLGPIGLLLGPFVGAFLAEMVAGREARRAFRGGIGAVVGYFVGAALEIAVGIGLLASFAWTVLNVPR